MWRDSHVWRDSCCGRVYRLIIPLTPYAWHDSHVWACDSQPCRSWLIACDTRLDTYDSSCVICLFKWGGCVSQLCHTWLGMCDICHTRRVMSHITCHTWLVMCDMTRSVWHDSSSDGVHLLLRMSFVTCYMWYIACDVWHDSSFGTWLI